MRRWNGWGDDATEVHPSPSLLALLEDAIGVGERPRDATFAAVCDTVPKSRLPEHPLLATDAPTRVRHARGQSLPDLVALRSGAGIVFPDGVALPTSEADVKALLAFAREREVTVIPYGGGTSVVGHVNPLPGPRPVLTLSLSRLAALRHFDEESRLATFEAGVAGPPLESQLRTLGYTLGHFPQSFELSTLGGWVATRSSGQQSRAYGRIEDLFAGGTLVSPAGTLRLPPFPASAAGPDLRQLVLGSEGRLGILSEAIIRVSPRPERERFDGVFLPGWPAALQAARRLAQSGLPLSMVRVSGPLETATNLVLAGRPRAVAALEAYLRLRRLGPQKCLALLGFTGRTGQVRATRRAALRVLAGEGAISAGPFMGRPWERSRFRTPYLRNTLWETGYAVDTVETATTWSRVAHLVEALETALRKALLTAGERVHAFTHLSHVYASGASVYTTFVFRTGAEPAGTLERWRALKSAACRAIVGEGATISHQHGVGADHAPYLEAEKGALGISALEHLLPAFDEKGLLNPGKLLPPRSGA
jgi:alkyldihydroxyacetonephosphate synthase